MEEETLLGEVEEACRKATELGVGSWVNKGTPGRPAEDTGKEDPCVVGPEAMRSPGTGGLKDKEGNGFEEAMGSKKDTRQASGF